VVSRGESQISKYKIVKTMYLVCLSIKLNFSLMSFTLYLYYSSSLLFTISLMNYLTFELGYIHLLFEFGFQLQLMFEFNHAT
jgi:hypothetical protein